MSGTSERPAFSVLEPTRRAVPVVVHVPHAGTWIPADERGSFLLADEQLAEELRLMTDHRTDALAGTAYQLGATVIVNHLSRLVVDPERFADGGEEMEQVGMGFAYERTAHGDPLRDLSEDDRARLRRRWFDPYSQVLASTVHGMVTDHGHCVVLDVHSYPERRLPYELHGDGPRPEVCLGTDAFHTPAWLVEGIERLCTERGFEAGRDTPFAGVYIPAWAYRRDERVQGVMLDIRRDAYIDEGNLDLHDGEERVRRLVEDVVRFAGRRVASEA